MTTAPDASSFRDPDGFVFTRDGVVYRQVNESHRQRYDHLLASGLYDALVGAGLLVAHEEVDADLAPEPPAYKVLRPEPIPFISYPYEWCVGQLRDAALATLRIQGIALDHGAWLRDASAYNIQFRRGRPLLIDTLSFAPREPDAPWPAYRQFCEHFLAPLALMSLVDVRLGHLLRSQIDGIPLDLASELLPTRTRLRPGLQLHVHAHARSQARHQARQTTRAAQTKATGEAKAGRRGTVGDRALRGLIDSLTGAVRKLDWSPPPSVWRDYDELGSYEATAFQHKTELVESFLDDTQPETVWDLGANTGYFSRLAAGKGAATVSLEADPSAVEVGYRRLDEQAPRPPGGEAEGGRARGASDEGGRQDSRAEGGGAKGGGAEGGGAEGGADGQTSDSPGPGEVLPLLVDLANPSPAQGWQHAERRSLADRGPADLALALALVHHLAIGNNVPLPRILAYLRTLCARLVVEWVPKHDPRVQTLLSGREDVFGQYTQEAFEDAARQGFTIERREPIRESDRVLYLLRAV